MQRIARARLCMRVTVCEFPHEFEVALEEIVAGQPAWLFPDDLFELKIFRLAGEIRHMEELEAKDGAIAVTDLVLFDLIADLSVDGEFLMEFAFQSIGSGFASLHLASRKFPLMRVSTALPLANEHAPVTFDHSSHHVHA